MIAEQSRKKWFVFSLVALVLAAAVIVVGFFILRHFRENLARYSPEQVVQDIISNMKYNDLAKVDKSQLSKHYDIPEGVVSDSSMYISKSSESAVEIACFLLTDTSEYDQLQTVVNKHIASKAAGFKSLNPTQFNTVKNYLITRNGRYVLVVIDSNTAAEEKLFDNLMK